MATAPQSSLSNSSTMYNHSVYGKNADHIFWFSMHNTSLGKNAEPTRGSTGLSVPLSARCRPDSGNVTEKLLCSACRAGVACPGRAAPRRASAPRTVGSSHSENLLETEGHWTVPAVGLRSVIGRNHHGVHLFICQNEISAQLGGQRESASSRWGKPQAFLCDSGRASVLSGGRGGKAHTNELAFLQRKVQIQDGKDELRMLKITFGTFKGRPSPGDAIRP